MNSKIIKLGNKELKIETGKLAKQADGSAVLTMGKTMILATVVSNNEAREDIDFLPLSVEWYTVHIFFLDLDMHSFK